MLPQILYDYNLYHHQIGEVYISQLMRWYVARIHANVYLILYWLFIKKMLDIYTEHKNLLIFLDKILDYNGYY